MKYVIVITVILIASFYLGLILGTIASDEDPEEQEREDRDQMEYLRKWKEKHKKPDCQICPVYRLPYRAQRRI